MEMRKVLLLGPRSVNPLEGKTVAQSSSSRSLYRPLLPSRTSPTDGTARGNCAGKLPLRYALDKSKISIELINLKLRRTVFLLDREHLLEQSNTVHRVGYMESSGEEQCD